MKCAQRKIRLSPFRLRLAAIWALRDDLQVGSPFQNVDGWQMPGKYRRAGRKEARLAKYRRYGWGMQERPD
jgi:hypothetical protein